PLRLISDADRAPLVMHCFAGKDRTGVLTALALTLLGVPDSEIMADYAASEAAQARIGTEIVRDADKRRLAGQDRAAPHDGTRVRPPPAHVLACPPQAIGLFLSELADRYGGASDGSARAAGGTAPHIAALRRPPLNPRPLAASACRSSIA